MGLIALIVVFAAFLMPALYSGALIGLAALTLSLKGLRPSAPLPPGSGVLIGLFAIFAGLAVLGPSFNHGVSGQNLDALKFLFVAASLVMGLSIGAQDNGMTRIIPLFIAVMAVFYGYLSFSGTSLTQESLLYPPDNNHSASMLAVFLPLVVLRMKGGLRLFCLLLLFAFAIFSASRALMALTILASAMSVKSIRQNRLLMAGVVALAVAALFYRGFSMDNFSDRLRLQIIEASLHFAQTRGAYAFNLGEAAFADYLNIYPVYQRLEIQHAHNMLLQVWVAYGLVPLGVFAAFLAVFAVQGWRQRNALFLACFTIFMALGMMEAIITDIRAFGTIIFTLGYTYTRGSLPANRGHSAQDLTRFAPADIRRYSGGGAV